MNARNRPLLILAVVLVVGVVGYLLLREPSGPVRADRGESGTAGIMLLMIVIIGAAAARRRRGKGDGSDG